MSLRIHHNQELDELRDSVRKIAEDMANPPKRKSSAAPLGADKHCIRVQKMYQNEQLAVAKFDKVEFSANGINYEGRRLHTAEFPDELILIVDDLKEKK